MMIRQHHVCAALFLLLLPVGAALRAEVVRIDFGASGSPVKEGFLGITPETLFRKGDKVGWLDNKDLAAVDWPIERTRRTVIFTNQWRQDSVQSRKPATLRIALPKGKYRVWAMAGPGKSATSQVWDITVANNSSSATATYFSGLSCRSVTFDAETDGQGFLDLSISTRSKWALNAMVIVSLDEWPKVRDKDIRKLEQEAFLLPDDVAKKWKHKPHVDKNRPPRYKAAEKKKGFVIYKKPWVTNVWPNTVPNRKEFNPKLKAFAAPNEYEPLTFTVMPLRDFEQAGVTVSDLRADDGSVIPAADIEVRYVQYRWVRPSYNVYDTYYRAPDMLPLLDDTRPLKAKENFRIWLTVNVRPYAKDGIYRGEASLALDGKNAAKVPIEFHVLPIELEKDLSHVYGTYYTHPERYISKAPDEFSRKWWTRKLENDFESMAAHGYNSFNHQIAFNQNKKGNWRAWLGDLQKNLEFARRHGFSVDKPAVCRFTYPLRKIYKRYMDSGDINSHLSGIKMPPQGFFDDVTAAIRACEAERKLRGLPEILYYPIDEPTRTTKESIDFMVAILRAIKKVPNVRIFVTADVSHPAFGPMKPYVDVWCINVFSIPQDTDAARKANPGVEYWCYPNHVAGENDHTPVAGSRMTYGFGLWRTGYKVLMPWTYQAFSGASENYLDGYSMDYFNDITADAEVLPCARYEAYREGIDDGRYLMTLERWIERVRGIGYEKEAKEAEMLVRKIYNSIDIAVSDYDKMAAWGWKNENLDRARWSLAKRILTLQELYKRR